VILSHKKLNELNQRQVLDPIMKLHGYEIMAPWRQNETTDIILVHTEKTINVSLKTASIANQNPDSRYFNKGKHPNHEYCNLVFAFLHDGKKLNQCFVFDSHEVYVENKKNKFCWNIPDRKHDLYDIDSQEFIDRVLHGHITYLPRTIKI
jgi:hypothetical protein